jgi:hypothetical protein
VSDAFQLNTYSVRYEMTIDRSPDEVWPHINHFELWNPEYEGATVETLAGAKDEEGQIVSIGKDPAYGDAFLTKVVKLVPGDQVLWATWSAGAGVQGGVGFIDIRVEPDGDGRTRYRYTANGFIPPDDAYDQKAFEEMITTRLDDVMGAFKAYAESA